MFLFGFDIFFFFKQKTAYEMRISDWSSDVCSSDLEERLADGHARLFQRSVRTEQQRPHLSAQGVRDRRHGLSVSPAFRNMFVTGSVDHSDWSDVVLRTSAQRTGQEVTMNTVTVKQVEVINRLQSERRWEDVPAMTTSEERRVGKECGMPGRTWGAP